MRPGRRGTARVVLLTVIEEEFGAARSCLASGGNVIKEIANSGYYTSDEKTLGVVLTMCTDRSNGPALEATQELIADYQPELVVICGIAGGIAGRRGVGDRAVEIGDVVVAETLHDIAFRKITEGRDSQRHYAFDQPSNGLLRHARALARDLDLKTETEMTCLPPDGCNPSPTLHIGPIVVFDAVLGDPKHSEQRRAVERVDNALALDMESVGIGRALHSARTAVDYNPRLVVVRGISDLIAVDDGNDSKGEIEDQNNVDRLAWKNYAAAAAASVAIRIIERFSADPDPRLRFPMRQLEVGPR